MPLTCFVLWAILRLNSSLLDFCTSSSIWLSFSDLKSAALLGFLFSAGAGAASSAATTRVSFRLFLLAVHAGCTDGHGAAPLLKQLCVPAKAPPNPSSAAIYRYVSARLSTPLPVCFAADLLDDSHSQCGPAVWTVWMALFFTAKP